MSNYKLSYSGSQINNAISRALNPDTTPTQDSTALITSGGVKAAIDDALDTVGDDIDALKTAVVFDYEDYKNNPDAALTLLQQALMDNKPVYCHYVNETSVTDLYLRYAGSYGSQWGSGTIHTDYTEVFSATWGDMVISMTLLHYDESQSKSPSWGNIDTFHGQASLIFDSAPTSGSYNPVYSKGIYSALAVKAPLASPSLTGTPTAPTPVSGDNSTKIATTAFVQAALGGVNGIYPCTTSTTYAQITAALAAGKLPVLIETVDGGYTIAYVYSNSDSTAHQFVLAGWSEYFSEGSLVSGGLSVSMMICSSASVWTQKEVIPVIAAQNGNFTLKATKTNSGVTYAWESDT